MAESTKDPFETQSLEALKALSKVMIQLGLYEPSHPSVEAILVDGLKLIEQTLAGCPRGTLAFAKDHEHWLANGKIIGGIKEISGPIAALITHFKLSSITFATGLTQKEMIALCELAALRADTEIDLKQFASDRALTHIRFNEAVYEKVGPGSRNKSGSGDGVEAGETHRSGADATGTNGSEDGKGAGQVDAPRNATEGFKGQTIDGSLRLLIKSIATDPAEQALIYEMIMKQLRLDIQQKVLEATATLRQEKTVVEFEAKRTQSVLQNVGEGVILIDQQGHILMMNPRAEEVYGSSLSQVAGKPLVAKHDDHHIVVLSSQMDPTMDTDAGKAVVIQGADDAKRTIRDSWALIKNEGGRVVGMVLALTDVAKHKRLEKIQREFVAHVTHELRAPLSSIQASLELLKMKFGKLAPDQEKLFSAATHNSKRLADIINEILDFSKIESGQMTVYPKVIDPVKLAEETVESLNPWALNKKISLSLTADSIMPPAFADPQRTVQVLVNLLSNAIKFTPAGGSITVTVARPESERWARFSVSDTGCGIPKSEQGRVFEEFAQASAGAAYVGGTGLGLTIAKSLIELQGGRMWFESEEGKGARFYFTLPLHIENTKRAPAPRPWWKRLLGRA